MTPHPGKTRGHGIAVFPFLKTRDPITLGSLTFRTTADTLGLDEEDSAHVREVAEMLFLQDDLRIKSATYAMLPSLDFDNSDRCLLELERIQAVIAYCYSSPHRTLDEPFLHSEHTSLAVFSPESVPISLVRPGHHVEATGPLSALTPDQWGHVPGYQGRYNFRHPFWVVNGSRLYPPVPHIGLNIREDLAFDLGQCFNEVPQHHLLPELLQEPATDTAARVLTAIAWYNRANALARDDNSAIIDLAVAFESLLALPKDDKTDRFVDAVSLLLGRITRLDLWARQFYDARSAIVHQGRAERLRFMPTKQKNQTDCPVYNSLLAYGRHVFQLCVGTLLFGARLGARTGLRYKLVTNRERFQSICKMLDDESLRVPDRFAAVDDMVALTSEFRFVRETGLPLADLIGTVQLAAKKLLLCGDLNSLEPVLKQCIQDLADAQRSPDWYEALGALRGLNDLWTTEPADPQSPEAITRRLADVIWHYTYVHYFWLKEQRDKGQQP